MTSNPVVRRVKIEWVTEMGPVAFVPVSFTWAAGRIFVVGARSEAWEVWGWAVLARRGSEGIGVFFIESVEKRNPLSFRSYSSPAIISCISCWK